MSNTAPASNWPVPLIIGAALMAVVVPTEVFAQPNTVVDPSADAAEMADTLVDPSGSIVVTDVEFIGADEAAGTFVDGPFGMEEGLAISNGLVEEMPFDPSGHDLSSTDLGTPGHELCEQVTGETDTYDAAVLQITFDVDDDVDGIEFGYSVGSDEYPDFVGTQYNDGFGVFLDADGFDRENVALDNDGNPININGPFFSGDTVVEYPYNEMNFEGATPRLSTQAPVWPGSTDNVIEIMVCDVADGLWDTAAFMTTLDPCYGDCEGTSVCGNGVVEPGEHCDIDDFHPDYAECPEGWEGDPMCNNDPDNPDGDGSCTVDDIPDGCTSIDYCADDSLNDCHDKAVCTDFPGPNYECDCIEGYAGDGTECLQIIEITEPEEGTVTNDPTPTISGTGEPGEEVTIYVDGEKVGTAEVDEDGQWEFTPEDDLEEGEVTVVATDGTSDDEVEFDIDVTPPSIQWTYPVDGGVYSTSPETLEGEAEPGAEVEVYVNGEHVGTTTADEDGNWSIELDEGLEDGEHEATARATDEAGNQSEEEIEFTVDTTAELFILEPDEGAVVRTTTPTVTGVAEPGATVEIWIDGEHVGTTTADEDGDWNWTPDEEMEDGEVTVVARTDSPSGDREDDVTFEIDTSTTEVVIQSPEDGAAVSDDRPEICGHAAPGATVEIWIDGEHVGTTTADDNGQWCYEPDESFDEGAVHVEVEAHDDGIVTEDEVEFVVDTTPPFLFVDSPEEDETVGPIGVEVVGQTEPDATVEVYLDGEHVGTTSADGDENWGLELDELDRGREYDLRVTSRDDAGNTAVVEHPFYVRGGYASGGGAACAAGGSAGPMGWVFAVVLALFALAGIRRLEQSGVAP